MCKPVSEKSNRCWVGCEEVTMLGIFYPTNFSSLGNNYPVCFLIFCYHSQFR